jgi:hypothetical protein
MKLEGYFNGDKCIQHNSRIAGNRSGFGSALQAMAAQGITMKYDRALRRLVRGMSYLRSARAHAAGS